MKYFIRTIVAAFAVCSLFAANGGIPFKVENGGKYDNKALPGDKAAFWAALNAATPNGPTTLGSALMLLSVPGSDSVLRINSDGSTSYLDSAALANWLGVTTDGALNAFAADPTSDASFDSAALPKWTDALSMGRALKLTRFKSALGRVKQAQLGTLPTPQVATLMNYGDSTGMTMFPNSAIQELVNKFGFHSVFLTWNNSNPLGACSTSNLGGGTDSGTIVHTYLGTGINAPNMALWFTGEYMELAASGNKILPITTLLYPVDTAEILYHTKPGGGTFGVYTLPPGGSRETIGTGGWQLVTTVDTNGSDGLATYACSFARTGSDPLMLLWASGSSDIVGVKLSDSTSSGIGYVHSAVGGLYGGDTVTMPQANADVILKLLAPDLISYEQKDGDSPTMAPIIASFATLVKTAAPGTPIIWIGDYTDSQWQSPANTDAAYAAQAALNSEDEFWQTSIDAPSWQFTLDQGWRRKDTVFTVASITRSGSTATLTTSAPHGLTTGSRIEVDDGDQPEYRGTYITPLTASGTTITYTVSGTPTTPATGTYHLYEDDGTHVNTTGSLVLASAFWRATGVFQIATGTSGENINNQTTITSALTLNGKDQETRNRELFSRGVGAVGVSVASGTTGYVRADRSAIIDTGSFTFVAFVRVPASVQNGYTPLSMRNIGVGGNEDLSCTLGALNTGSMQITTRESSTNYIYPAANGGTDFWSRAGQVVMVAIRRDAAPATGVFPLSVWVGRNKYACVDNTVGSAGGLESLSGKIITSPAGGFNTPSTHELYGMAFYPSALTDAQLIALAETQVFPSGYDVMIPCDDGFGAVARGYANSINGTLTGTAAWTRTRGLGGVITANTTSTITFNTAQLSETIYNTSASTIASSTITLPTASFPGQILTYFTHGAHTAVTMAGGTVVGAALTSLSADQTVEWKASATSGTWIRTR